MTRAQPDSFLKPKLLALSVAACFALNASLVRANPAGPTVVHGSVGFNGLGTSVLTISNQAGGNAIINWNGFSIGINELTKFQQFANLAVLNRVTSGQVSSILGSLQSDGRVFLINPNGIVFGASARIDVAGMVASSLNLSDQDFLSNRLRFTEVPGAGAVVNNGVIETATGGRVYLVAPTVENNGLIQAKQGEILLAAGKEVELVDGDAPFVTVKVTAGSESALNVGNLVAEGGRIGMFGALVRNSGTVEAGGAMVGPGGEIRLVATKDLTLDAGSLVAANGTSGGKVLLQAEGGTNLISGTVQAKGLAGKGGEVSALGVRVGVVGHGLIDASGETGGGTVLVGGDYQGKNAAVQNAERTYIGSDGVIRADAMTTGDGGRVVVWADGDTRFFGSISAKGGSQSGNGGFVETSGKQNLVAAGSVDAGASNGAGGTWLLDPENINIVATTGANDIEIAVDGLLAFVEQPGATSEIGVLGIWAAMLGGTDVVLQANNDINLATTVDTTIYGGRSLTFAAGHDINLGSNDVRTDGNLTISAANSINGGSGYPGNTLQSVNGNVTLSGPFNGGAVDILAYGSVSAGAISADSYNSAVNIAASNGSITTGSITTSPANDGTSLVSLTASYGSIIVNGSITSGNNGIALNAGQNVTTGALVVNADPFFGFGGGDVQISAAVINTGGITTSGGSVNAFAFAGNLSAGAVTTGGGGVSMGASGGKVAVGAISTSNTGDPANTFGNGNIFIDADQGITTGAITTRSLNPALGGGGNVVLKTSEGTIVVNGNIDTQGAAGVPQLIDDCGECGNHYYAGTDGGFVGLFQNAEGTPAGAAVQVNGSILTAGGAGYGAVNGSFMNQSGGRGGDVEIGADGCGEGCLGGSLTGSVVVTGSIVTSGGNGGATTSADFTQTFGGDGGNVTVLASGSIATTAIATSGGNAGAGSDGAYGENYGGWGGSVSLFAGGGSATTGSITTSGGAGGNAGGIISSGFSNGGQGGTAGSIGVEGTSVSIAGGIAAVGGAGGAAGTGGGYSEALGGDGGNGGAIALSGFADAVDVAGTIDGSGGNGGAGGVASDYASGGSGGSASGVFCCAQKFLVSGELALIDQEVIISPDFTLAGINIGATSISTGAIIARGGAGGAGGKVSNGNDSAFGGDGGSGAFVSIFTTVDGGTFGTGPISTGLIDVSGGNGGNSGAVDTNATWGGWGGNGAFVGVYGSAVNIAGPILAGGGDGGHALNSSIPSVGCPTCTPDGGGGGYGGSVSVYGLGEVQFNVGGTLGATAIDVSGGAGGNGAAANSPAGNGGSGGQGGSVDVLGTPNMTLFGSIDASGGDGGLGGAGNLSNPAGTGGLGGIGGNINLNAGTVDSLAAGIGDGIIFVLAGTQFDVNGGLIGGSTDLRSPPGVFSFLGTIVILDPLSVPGINEGFQQVIEGAGDTTAFVGGEKKDEEEDKSQKELGSCKG